MRKSTYSKNAYEFRKAFNLEGSLDRGSLNLQTGLISEEHREVLEAVRELLWNVEHPVAREHLLKELTDLVYVCHQMAACFDWDLDEAYKRVHRSNMSKLDENGKPIYRQDGKVLKGPNYYLPNLKDLI